MAPRESSPAAQPDAAPVGVRENGHRWHHIYFLLAAFNMATVLFSLALSQHLASTYIASVDINEEWAERQLSFSKLREHGLGGECAWQRRIQLARTPRPR